MVSEWRVDDIATLQFFTRSRVPVVDEKNDITHKIDATKKRTFQILGEETNFLSNFLIFFPYLKWGTVPHTSPKPSFYPLSQKWRFSPKPSYLILVKIFSIEQS